MYRRFIERNQLTHSLNPYIHKCCGCIHLRMGATIACLIWAGLSLYFAIISFQDKSPFYSYMDSTALYIFGIINLVLFGVSLAALIPLFLKLHNAVRAASNIINIVIFLFLIDMIINTILFITRREDYVSWCINSTDVYLNNTLFNEQSIIQNNNTQQNITIVMGNFTVGMTDFYNCNRTWEDELKFSLLSTLVIIFVYFYWALSIVSYTVKLRMRIKKELMLRMGIMAPPPGLILPSQTGPITAV